MDENTKDQIICKGPSFVCLECKNENAIIDPEVGKVLECDFCGIEYEVKEKNDKDNCILQIIEEEK